MLEGRAGTLSGMKEDGRVDPVRVVSKLGVVELIIRCRWFSDDQCVVGSRGDSGGDNAKQHRILLPYILSTMIVGSRLTLGSEVALTFMR